MHRKLSKDKILHSERLGRSSEGFAALLEGDLIEADEGVRRSHPTTYDFYTQSGTETSRDNRGLILLRWNNEKKKIENTKKTGEAEMLSRVWQ